MSHDVAAEQNCIPELRRLCRDARTGTRPGLDAREAFDELERGYQVIADAASVAK